MSAKSSRPGKKVELPKVPRPMAEIEAENAQLLSQVANFQYLAYVYTKQTEQINWQINNLGNEASARKELDAKAAKAAATAGEVADV